MVRCGGVRGGRVSEVHIHATGGGCTQQRLGLGTRLLRHLIGFCSLQLRPSAQPRDQAA